MTLAEQAKAANQFSADQLTFIKKNILESLKGGGYHTFICDRHIGEIKCSTIPMRFESALIDLIRKEGLRYEWCYNGYGVRYIKITL